MEFKELMRPAVKDDWGIKKLQNCLLNIMKYIHDFCEENNIEYCIMGGTALGAIRHGGFIPWDDDIDIFMTPDNYEKFRYLFNKKGDKNNFYLQELGKSGQLVHSAKFRLNNSEFIQDSLANLDIHHGIFVDIMILLNTPNNIIGRKWQWFWEIYVRGKFISNMHYKSDSKIKAIIYSLMRLTPKRFLIDFALKQIYKYQKVDCENFFHPYIGKPMYKSIYPKSIFENLLLIDFESIKLLIPQGIDEYLKILFGDYMKLPDFESIKSSQHVDKWSCEHSFQPRKSGTFEDEKYYW